MTAPDIAAICERHGITTHSDANIVHPWIAFYQMDSDDADRSGGAAFAHEESDAVVALLKARYDIRTGAPRAISGTVWLAVWWVKGQPTETIKSRRGPTELAAVAALADRLAGVAP